MGAYPVRDLARKSGDGIVLRQARHIRVNENAGVYDLSISKRR